MALGDSHAAAAGGGERQQGRTRVSVAQKGSAAAGRQCRVSSAHCPPNYPMCSPRTQLLGDASPLRHRLAAVQVVGVDDDALQRQRERGGAVSRRREWAAASGGGTREWRAFGAGRRVSDASA